MPNEPPYPRILFRGRVTEPEGIPIIEQRTVLQTA